MRLDNRKTSGRFQSVANLLISISGFSKTKIFRFSWSFSDVMRLETFLHRRNINIRLDWIGLTLLLIVRNRICLKINFTANTYRNMNMNMKHRNLCSLNNSRRVKINNFKCLLVLFGVCGLKLSETQCNQRVNPHVSRHSLLAFRIAKPALAWGRVGEGRVVAQAPYSGWDQSRNNFQVIPVAVVLGLYNYCSCPVERG